MIATSKWLSCFYLILGTLMMSIKLSAQDNLFIMPHGIESRSSTFENINGIRGAGGVSNRGAKGHAFEPLKAGESKTLLDTDSAGIIRRIWVTIRDRSPIILRSLRLQMYWDGSTKPAVDVPFGDFFCAGLGIATEFQSALFSNPEGRSFNCYIPMPFKKGARVILTNESNSDIDLLFFEIDFSTTTTLPEDMLYFHACWNRSIHTALGNDFELLPAITGRGRLLGVNIGINIDSVYGQTWWGEGEVKLYMDGDKNYPTINGTGAEDYIGTGWGEGHFTHLYQGCTVADERKRQYAFYRFYIPDPVYFHKNIRATIQEMGGGEYDEVMQLKAKGAAMIPVSVAGEHEFTRLMDNPQSLLNPDFKKGWVNFFRVDDYSATAYFYLDRPSSNLKELVSVEERIK